MRLHSGPNNDMNVSVYRGARFLWLMFPFLTCYKDSTRILYLSSFLLSLHFGFTNLSCTLSGIRIISLPFNASKVPTTTVLAPINEGSAHECLFNDKSAKQTSTTAATTTTATTIATGVTTCSLGTIQTCRRLMTECLSVCQA
jgi:hypothetical protein